MRYILVIIIFSTLISRAEASIAEGGTGVLFGNDHTFSFTAVEGWVLDNQSGVDQGLHMIFYPKGQTWRDSPVIMYGRAVPVSSVQSDFRRNGSIDYKSEERDALNLGGGKQADIYHFSGDQGGNYEAVAYIQEIDTINFLVFNSRSKKHFEKYLANFYQIVKSYNNLYISPSEIGQKNIDKLKYESQRLLDSPEGKDYETAATKFIGQKMANALGGCTSYFPSGALPPFTYYAVIGEAGNLVDSTSYPITTLSSCFRGLMYDSEFPVHEFTEFVLKIDIKITP